MPVPHSKRASKAVTPSIAACKPATSSWSIPAGLHLARLGHLAVAAMPTDVKPDPVEVGFFSTQAIVKVTNSLPNLVKQA